MQIQRVEKHMGLSGILDSVRLHGKYNIIVDQTTFNSLFVTEVRINRSVYSEDRVIVVYCDLHSRQLPDLIEKLLKAGECSVILIDVKDTTKSTMQVNRIATTLHITGHGLKTYQPGPHVCSLKIENQEIATLLAYFQDNSANEPHANVDDIRDDDELLLMQAIADNLECSLG